MLGTPVKGRVGILSMQTNNHDVGSPAMEVRIDSVVVEIGRK
jgi:hypothetical protein